MKLLIIFCLIADIMLGCCGQRPCNLFCDENGNGPPPSLSKGATGSPGKQGAKVKDIYD